MKKILLLAVFGFVISSAKSTVPEASTSELKKCKLKIGDTYAGGIIFYLDPVNSCHGLVCAPSDQSSGTTWQDAGDLCKSLIIGPYSDWRLPTDEELNEMYMNLYKTGLGGFANNYYWGSSVNNNGLAYSQYFINAYQNVYRYVKKGFIFRVRAVRAF